MYDEILTRQSLPSEQYCYLLGVCMSVFASNFGFLIENILRLDNTDTENWYRLIDETAGSRKITNLLKRYSEFDTDFQNLYADIVERRNRIIHGFRITSRITSQSNEQILGTKVKSTGEQFEITIDYLKEFIKQNEIISDKLHKIRGY